MYKIIYMQYNRCLFIFVFIILSKLSIYAQIETSIPAEKPKLVIGIVVEQMRFDYIESFWNNFSDKGFKKLAINGSYCRNVNLNYSFTQTAPGYASISTGSEPSEHGIVANYWFNPLTNKKEYCIYDSHISGLNSDNDNKYSPNNIFTTSFSDHAKLFNNGNSKIISISLSPIAAVISGSYTADAAYWFDTKTGQWTSSKYYMQKLPSWLIEINNKKIPDDYLLREWKPSLEVDKYCIDTTIYKFGIDGVYKKFPYIYQNIIKTIKDYELLTYVPEGNTLTTDLAIAALYNEELGKDNNTDFLFVNYSVSENIGKLFGPSSMETQDLFIKLDKEIAHLVSVLEETVGKNNFLLYLCSNHGVADVPQYLIDNKMPAGTFKQYYILALLKSYLKAIYGEGDWILDFNNKQIYLNKTLIEDSQISLTEFQNKVLAFIINSSGISNAISSQQFQSTNFTQGMALKMKNSFNQKRSGDIMISLKSGWIEDIPFATDHNSGYKYDTHVPLIWYGWKVKKQYIYKELNITDIAPTISTILGTPPPPTATGNTIQEIFINK